MCEVEVNPQRSSPVPPLGHFRYNRRSLAKSIGTGENCERSGLVSSVQANTSRCNTIPERCDRDNGRVIVTQEPAGIVDLDECCSEESGAPRIPNNGT